MKPAEGYLYVIVCMRIYEVNGPCADTLDALCRRTGFNRRVVSDAMDLLFRSGKLVRTPAGITNPFAEDVIAIRRSIHEKRKSAGREGGLKSAEITKSFQSRRASKPQSKTQQDSTHLHLHKDSSSPSGELALANSGEKIPTAVATTPGIAHPDPEADLFRRGKEVLGKQAGGMIRNLLGRKGGNVAKARAAIEEASTKENAREYIGATIRGPKLGTNGAAAALRRRIEERTNGESDDDHDDVSTGGGGRPQLDPRGRYP